MFGALTVEGQVLIDPEDQNPNIFFIFDDVNIKVMGDYILQCQVIDMDT